MNKYEAVLPDGSVAKRSSQNRVYSHCVAVRDSYADAIDNARKRHPILTHNHSYHVAVFNGEHEHSKLNNAVESARKAVEKYGEDVMEAVDKMVDEAIAGVEAKKAAGGYDKWYVAGWNGRYDLALKMASSQACMWRVEEAKIVKAVLK